MMSSIRTKKCSKCGLESDEEAFFRKKNDPRSRLSALGLTDYHSVCVGCEITDRNEPSPQERARRKAQNSINLHAEKYGMKPSEFAKRFGWDIDRMIYDILHGHENTCPYCYVRYDVMEHGLTDITLDILDPKADPY